jgi:hypothetical protein
MSFSTEAVERGAADIRRQSRNSIAGATITETIGAARSGTARSSVAVPDVAILNMAPAAATADRCAPPKRLNFSDYQPLPRLQPTAPSQNEAGAVLNARVPIPVRLDPRQIARKSARFQRSQRPAIPPHPFPC